MSSIFWRISGVKIVPSLTTTAITTSAEVPNSDANLSWAAMNGCSGHSERSLASSRTCGPGNGSPTPVVMALMVG
jgi:hypothetical protein